MADSDTNRAAGKSGDDSILAEARKRYSRAMDKERANISAAYEDLEFLAGAGLSQWDASAKKDREGRPTLQVNQLPQFVHQVTGDIRQMKPSIKVVPVDDQADPKLAEIRGGMIRYIENRSDAPGIYFQAADSQVAAGIGHWRVLAEYADDTTFEQELRIAGVDDGVSVLWDPDAKLLTREDAKFCFVPIDYSSDLFKELWPNANPASLDEAIRDWNYYSDWVSSDTVRVAEYWVKKPAKFKLALTPDGQTINLTDEPDAEQLLAAKFPQGVRLEERESYKVCRYLITASQILEGPDEWMGRFIPIVPVIGEEVRIGPKVIRKGIVRDAKDPQRMYNYFRSAQTEVVALQPKAPFLVTEVNVAKYQTVWNEVNRQNYPYLPWTPDPKNGNAPPTRVAPAVSSQGVDEGVSQANEDLRRVIGIYDASLGAKSNETSGKAILARQREGDTGTYVFIDNFNRAVRHTGKILIDLIPHVYDTQRTIRIMGEDGKLDLMKINQEIDQSGQPIMGQDGNPAVLNDMGVGAYDVVAEMGPSYATKREESREGMTAFMQAVPDAAPLMLDLYAKAQDWPMADKFAKRFRAALPPAVAQAEELEEQGASPEEIKAAMQPQADPMQQMQGQAMQETLQAQVLEAQAKTRQAEANAAKAEAEAEEARLKLEATRLELASRGMKLQYADDQHRQSMRHAEDDHIANLARGEEVHAAQISHDDDTHFAGLQHGAEKHQAQIDRMREPRPSA